MKVAVLFSLCLALPLAAAEQEIIAEIATTTNDVPSVASESQPARMRINLETGIVFINTGRAAGHDPQRFKLKVTGLPPKATFALKINGAEAGTLTTDSAGRLRLHAWTDGIELDAITVMEFIEPGTTNALTISF